MGIHAEVEGLTSTALAREVAIDLPVGSYVNLGIGLPQSVSGQVTPGQEVTFHSENGILGLGPGAAPGEEDPDLIDAGKSPATLVAGGSYVSHTDSFVIVRGGHLDVCVLGAFEVSVHGDLANWTDGQGVPAVGGAMDLAVGALRTVVLMRHNDREGRPKLVSRCILPLTAPNCVDRVYTDLGIFEPAGGRFRVLALVTGLSVDDLNEPDVEYFAEALPTRLPRAEGSPISYRPRPPAGTARLA